MKVWAQWYGGCNYRAPEHDEFEEFSSIKVARDVFWSRFSDSRFPCVSEEDAEMWVFTSDPTDGDYRYPDFSFRLGPRGGVIRSSC